jgi:hypothetical protein
MKELAADIDQSLMLLQTQLTSLRSLVETRHKECGQEFYSTLMDSLAQRMNALNISNRTFNQVLLRDLSNPIASKGKTGTARPPLTGLASYINRFWNRLPRTEAEAVIASVEAFDTGCARETETSTSMPSSI